MAGVGEDGQGKVRRGDTRTENGRTGNRNENSGKERLEEWGEEIGKAGDAGIGGRYWRRRGEAGKGKWEGRKQGEENAREKRTEAGKGREKTGEVGTGRVGKEERGRSREGRVGRKRGEGRVAVP